MAVGVNAPTGDNALRKGIQMDVFCKSPKDGRYFKGYVWPGNSYFPDFFHPNSSVYWQEMMEELHSKTRFTGIWLDMNEPANFCNGECDWSTHSDRERNIIYYL